MHSDGIEKGLRSSSGKARTAAKLNIWRGFATPHGGDLSPFSLRISDSGHWQAGTLLEA
jgi:hypothetical protein